MSVSEQIIQVLDALCEKFGIVIDWTSESVIPYLSVLCEKLVAWEIWSSVAWIAIVVVLTIAGTIVLKMLWPTLMAGWEKDEESYDCGWYVITIFAVTAFVAICVATFTVICFQAMDIIKCATFPEMYVIEYIKSLVGSGS